jgi:predicted permease
VNLRGQALGFRPDNLLLFRLDATTAGYEGARLYDFYGQVLERVAVTPGVQGAAMSRHALIGDGATRDGIQVPGKPAGRDQVGVHIHYVSPGYFTTMGIPLLDGRDVGDQDREGTPRVLLVNRALARQLGEAPSPVGQQVLLLEPKGHAEVIGLVGDARFSSLRDAAPPTMYVPYRQHRQHQMTFAARIRGDPAAVMGPVRRAIAAIDSNIPVFHALTQQTQIDMAVRQERVFAYVASGFALLALLLSCLGLYGTLAYGVARRVPEIGVRMALGASRASVVRMVLRESLIPVAAGAVIGVGAALATSRFLESLLFDVEPRDPVTIAATTCALMAAALLAAWLPSRRAATVDPVTALRCE